MLGLQFALRWRTESEVISGAGESTCANTRCALHSPRNIDDGLCSLKTLELPFSYEERGERKLAMVKVVLCDKCCGKLMWKRRKEKELQGEKETETETEPGKSGEHLRPSGRQGKRKGHAEMKGPPVSVFP